MKIRFAIALAFATIGILALSAPTFAQQKTVKACQAEWRANKAAYQAAGITEQAYVEKCRAGVAVPPPKATTAPATAPAKKAAAPASPSPKKTVRACEEEWKANKAAYQAAGIAQKAYVEKCRAGIATPVPPPPKASTAPAPAQTKPATTTAPPPPKATTTPTPAQTKPVTTPAPPATKPAPAPAAVGSPTGAGQFVTEAQARARCPGDTVVWINLNSKVYHFSGYKAYGHTKSGAYMCEKDTAAAGFRAAKNEKHP